LREVKLPSEVALGCWGKIFDAEGGSYLVRETIKALDALELTGDVRRQIDIGNISRLIRGDRVRASPASGAARRFQRKDRRIDGYR
jgi:hypothetical protein